MSKTRLTLRTRIIKWTIVLFVVCLIFTCNYLSSNVDEFKCDIVHGSDHLPGWSGSKSEAIKRKTFVCDLILTHTSFDNNKAYDLKPLKGWLESSWRDGFWYLTTTKDTGKDINYRLTIYDPGDNRNWKVINDEQNGYGDVMLQFYKEDGQFQGFIDKHPLPDSLFYNVLKTDSLKFVKENIEGRFKIVLLKH